MHFQYSLAMFYIKQRSFTEYCEQDFVGGLAVAMSVAGDDEYVVGVHWFDAANEEIKLFLGLKTNRPKIK